MQSTHHMDCVPIYIRTIHFCTAACTGICALFSIFNGTRDDDVNGKPTVKNMSIQVNQNDEFPYVVSSQHWAYLWLAYPLYCIVSLHALLLPSARLCKPRGRTSSCAQNVFFQNWTVEACK